MVYKDLQVVVVGGSLSGMFAAVMLHDLGYSVTVLERYEKGKLLDQGAGLRLGDDVAKFLDAHNLIAYGIPASRVIVFDMDGSIAQEGPLSGSLTNWSTIHGVLKRYFEQSNANGSKAVFRYGCYVTRVEEAGDLVKVIFETQGQQQSLEADLVIGADGAGSKVRSSFFPDLKRKYVDYIIYRGLARPEDTSEATRKLLLDSATWHFGLDNMCITYTVPGSDDIEDDRPKGERKFFNFAYYSFVTDEVLNELLTDIDGKRHIFSIPMGKLRPVMVDLIKATARKQLPPQLAEVVEKTEKPFVQVPTDVIAPETCFLNGKVFLIGDAAAGVRPHAAAATSQAIFHVTKLREMLEGKMSVTAWSEISRKYSLIIYNSAIEMGNILMHQPISLEGKINTFMPKFRNTHVELDKLYNELA